MANFLNNRFMTNTYNSMFPWLNKTNYDKVIAYGNSLWIEDEEQKRRAENSYYRKNVNKMVNDQILDERDDEINQQTYQAWRINSKDADIDLRTTLLSQELKRKYNLDATYDDAKLVEKFVKKLTPEWQALAWKYLAWESDEFLYVTWLSERPQEEKNKTEDDGKQYSWFATHTDELWQQAKNIVWWAYDSATWAPRFLAKWAADVIGWTAKQLWADEDKVSNLVQSYKDYLDNDWSSKDIGADQDSIAYNATKAIWDLSQVIWGEALLKWAISWTAKWAELMNYLKNAPTWQKMIAWGIEWAWDMTLYSIVADSELPTTEEVWLWSIIGATIPWWARLYWAVKPSIQKSLQKTASKLELSWLLNPAKLNTIKNQLINEWTDLAKAWLKGWEAEDVGKWMIDRWFKWDKPTIIKDLWEYAKKSHNLKREVLWASDTLHTVESANKSLEAIHNTIKDVPGLEKKLARVEELMSKEKHTLSELDEIKSILDDTISIYTNAWDVRAWAVKEWLDMVRKDLRKYIEDAATKEWLGNVKMLNNETQISKALEDAISRKDSADAAREMLSVFSKSAIWGAAWYNVWPFDNNTLWGKLGNIAVWALAWKYLFSTKAKTEFAWLINKMSWSSKKELERLVAWDLAAKKLSNKTKKELLNVFEEAWITTANTPKEMTAEEMNALLKKYSYWDIPALEFKEWVNDAWKNILVWDSEKIISTPSWAALREWKIAEIPNKVNKIDDLLPLSKRVSWDDLLNAEDLIDDLKQVWAKVDENWYVTLYHQTTDKAAENILNTGKMSWKEKWIFFSTSKDAQQAAWRWGKKLEFKIPVEKLELDDIFTNNADVKILTKPWEEIDVTEYLVKNL